MALQLFRCCIGARASEGHGGMQVHLGQPYVIEHWGRWGVVILICV